MMKTSVEKMDTLKSSPLNVQKKFLFQILHQRQNISVIRKCKKLTVGLSWNILYTKKTQNIKNDWFSE